MKITKTLISLFIMTSFIACDSDKEAPLSSIKVTLPSPGSGTESTSESNLEAESTAIERDQQSDDDQSEMVEEPSSSLSYHEAEALFIKETNYLFINDEDGEISLVFNPELTEKIALTETVLKGFKDFLNETKKLADENKLDIHQLKRRETVEQKFKLLQAKYDLELIIKDYQNISAHYDNDDIKNLEQKQIKTRLRNIQELQTFLARSLDNILAVELISQTAANVITQSLKKMQEEYLMEKEYSEIIQNN